MKGRSEQKVLSASRRTDIPAFYMNWFMARIREAAFQRVNPYSGRVSTLHATPETVRTIVFWSKNFGPFIEGGYGESLASQGFHLFFNFTVNSESKILEPKVPALKERLKQLDALCQRFDSNTVTWRFDPICWFMEAGKPLQDNMADLEKIADHASRFGVKRCITSFLDFYPKIRRRLNRRPDLPPEFGFVDPPLEKKTALLSRMERMLDERGIRLFTCCEKEVLEALPHGHRVQGASCISNALLMSLFGGDLSMKGDPGQRIKSGCGCQVSVDVGSYRDHPCFHDCLFCYANPASYPTG